MRTFAVMMNPKTMDLVAISADENEGSEVDVICSIFGDRDAEVAASYYHPGSTETDEYGGRYPRIHAPRGVKRELRGQGFGLLLYSGAALAAARDEKWEGVHSIVGNRSEDAESLWESFVRKRYAHRESTGGRSENCDTEEVEHCEEIPDQNREAENSEGYPGWITSSEVCGKVEAEFCRDEEADFLSASAVLATGLVLVYQSESSEGIEEETTETMNLDLIVRARIRNAEAAQRMYDHLRRGTDSEILAAFVSRPDIQEMLFGQGRLPFPPVEGLGRAPLERPHHFVPLPPLSEESRAILERWKDIG